MNFFFFNSETMSKVLDSFKSLELKGNFKTSSLINFEYIFGNISFIVLFIAVLLYWFDFSDTKPVTKKLKNFCMWSSNLSLTLLLIVRWWESGHFPLSNLYESLIGLAWGFTTVHLIITFDGTNFFRKNKNKKALVLTSFALSVPGTDSPSCGSEYKSEPYKLNSSALSCYDQFTPKFTPRQDRSLNEVHVPQVGARSAIERTVPLIRPEVSLLSKSLNNVELGRNSKNFVPSFGRTQKPEEVEYVNNLQQKNNEKIGAITAPTALLTSVFATFFLPPEMLKATTLIPALKSNWLTMHVSVMVTSYAFLLVGSLLSIAFCAYRFVTNSEVSPVNQHHWSFFFKDIWPFQSADFQGNHKESDDYSSNRNKANEKKNQLEICIWLNTTSYRILGLGFPLLTIGILSGAVWANEAWGSYWSWDPKETWALITWLVFAIYFHSRYNRSSEDSVIPASIASVGFVVIWICYLGVNLLGKGLHSYGGFGT